MLLPGSWGRGACACVGAEEVCVCVDFRHLGSGGCVPLKGCLSSLLLIAVSLRVGSERVFVLVPRDVLSSWV